MRSLLAALWAVCFLVTPAAGETYVCVNGAGTLLVRDVEDGATTIDQVGDLFVDLVVSGDFGADSQADVVLSYDGDDLAGLGIRYYKDLYGGAVLRPGIGLRGFYLGEDRDFVNESTGYLGGEILVDVMNFVPATAFIGVYTDIFGEDGTKLIQMGASYNFPIKQSEY